MRLGGLDPFGPPDEVRRLRRATGMIRQRDDLVPSLSARLNALLPTVSAWRPRDWLAVLRGGVPPQQAARLRLLAGRHGVTDCLPAQAERLSGGQRRRIALVRALLPDPRLLLADEPTTGLDQPGAAAVVDALRAAEAATLIITTHDLAVARRFERTVVLRDRRVAYDGPTPREPELLDLYGAAP